MAEYKNSERNVFPEGVDAKNPSAKTAMKTGMRVEFFDGDIYVRYFPLRQSLVEGRCFIDIGAYIDSTLGEVEVVWEKPKRVFKRGRQNDVEVAS